MKIIKLKTKDHISTILIGQSLRNLNEFIPANSIYITDKNVFDIYSNLFHSKTSIVLKPGEQSKTTKTIEEICGQLLELNADRNTFLIGVGGGVISDIAGFVASIYKRGIKFGFVSTTLLGQVDAAIGGKNGINLSGYKNIIGVVNQPEFTISDINFLETLPETELINGFAELIKIALVADVKLFNELESSVKDIFELDKELLEHFIYRAAKIKSSIVEKDETEIDLRRLLNFGHTFGHAIEMVHNISHGQAVIHGIIIALKLSQALLGMNEVILNRVDKIFSQKIKIGELHLDKLKIMDAIEKDKKNYGEYLKLVLLKDVANPIIHDTNTIDIKDLFYDMR